MSNGSIFYTTTDTEAPFTLDVQLTSLNEIVAYIYVITKLGIAVLHIIVL